MKGRIIHILRVTLGITCALGLLVLLGFVDQKQEQVLGKKLNIVIHQNDEHFFIDQNDVRKILLNKGDSVIGQPLGEINTNQLEKVFDTHPAISKSQVFITGNGILNIHLWQRVPLVRVFNESGENYYLDTEGKLMPLSEKYTARILVCSGQIDEPFASNYQININNIIKDHKEATKSALDDIFILANFINSHPFWKAAIKQAYMNEDKEFELSTLISDHKIILGDVRDLENKFNKLMLFYKEGLSYTGHWNKYSKVNLMYKNQVVCTKK